MPKRIKEQRRRLWEKNPHCEKCGTLTILPEDIPTVMRSHHTRSANPDNMATIQHKYSRLSKHRQHQHDRSERRHFLWCNRCNKKDNVDTQDARRLTLRVIEI